MASPHVAGLAAYFLSLYPTGFSVEQDDFTDSAYAKIAGEVDVSSFIQQGVQFVFGKLRQSTAPIPPKEELTTKALKKALLKVSSKGRLVGVSLFLALA